MITDKLGNCLFRKEGTQDIYLSLKSEDRIRKVGTIKNKTTIVIKRSSKKHLFIKGNAYGFNYELLAKLNHVNMVELHIDKDTYLIPVAHILDKGQFLLFSQQGFELQIFLNLKQLEQWKQKETSEG